MNILDLKVGKQKRTTKIINISAENVTQKDGRISKKVIFTVKEPKSNLKFEVSDAWVTNSKGNNNLNPKGLWVDTHEEKGTISNTSTLGKVLQYYKVETIGDLNGKLVELYPDKKNYLVLIAYDMK